jgi:hypothetical protein
MVDGLCSRMNACTPNATSKQQTTINRGGVLCRDTYIYVYMYISTYQICVDSPSLAEYVLSVDRTYVPPAAYKPEAINAGHHIRRIMKCVRARRKGGLDNVRAARQCMSIDH